MVDSFLVAVPHYIQVVSDDPAPPGHDAVLEYEADQTLETFRLIDESLRRSEKNVGTSVWTVKCKVR